MIIIKVESLSYNFIFSHIYISFHTRIYLLFNKPQINFCIHYLLYYLKTKSWSEVLKCLCRPFCVALYTAAVCSCYIFCLIIFPRVLCSLHSHNCHIIPLNLCHDNTPKKTPQQKKIILCAVVFILDFILYFFACCCYINIHHQFTYTLYV